MTSYIARRTPVFNSPAAWAEILPNPPAYPSLVGDNTADVTIIGAGFAGLSAARRLHQLDKDLRIIVLDALRIAQGSAGRNSGFMIDLPHDLSSEDYAGQGVEADKRTISLNRQAIEFALNSADQYAILAPFVDPAGKINGAASGAGERHNRAYAKHLNNLGEASEHMDAQSMFEVTGSRHYRSGLFTKGTLMLQPAGYVRCLSQGIAAEGVAVFENSPVQGFSKVGADWVVKAAQGQITCRRIILANNGHLESFGIAQNRLMHVFLYASMTAELPAETLSELGGQPRWGITPSDPMGTTMRRINNGQGGHRIVTRTCGTFLPKMAAPASAIARAAAVHRQKFAQRFPNLADVPQQYSWAGHLCLTRNCVGYTKQIEDGVFAACVQNGLGTARGTLAGIAAAERTLGHPSNIADYFESEPSPQRLPPRPFAQIGANAYLRWKEWRAGKE